MRGPIILFGGTQTDREEKVLEIIDSEIEKKFSWNYLENVPDIKLIEVLEGKRSIGIDQIRGAIEFMMEKPLNYAIKTLIINRAEKMTPEAQNALLKTLEESRSYALILLLTRAENALLPTVISRCRKIRCKNYDIEELELEETKTFNYVLNLDLGERLDWVEENAKEEREDIVDLFGKWINEARKLLTEKHDKEFVHTLEKLAKAKEDLENTNVGVKSCLEFLLVGD